MMNDNETYLDHFSHLSVAIQYIFIFLRIVPSGVADIINGLAKA